MKKIRIVFCFLLCFCFLLTSISLTNESVSAASPSNSGRKYDQTLINDKSMLSYFSSHHQNHDPIIFVHGLFGWGEDELYGIHYWGGTGSLRNMLQQQGFTVYTPTIGPIASNWDRACELYAYLVGGTVDYGKAHSEKYGHARYGRTFPGVYKELLSSDGLHKVHLVGHSMGGETIRVLAQLLEQGDANEVSTTGKDTSPLFKGNHHYIRSITTIATPHDGSQYDEVGSRFEPFFHNLFAFLAAQTGATNHKSELDFRMDQWGLKQKEGESYKDYCSRVFHSKIWSKTTDLSSYDLSLEGARDLNSWVKAQDDIYYFSISCSDSHKGLLTRNQIPNINMSPILVKSSLVMGSFTQNKPGYVTVLNDWWENDGIVSVRSAIAPHEGSTDQLQPYGSPFLKGSWNYLGKVVDTDHIEVVGQQQYSHKNELQNLFINLANMMYSLQ